jgi:hypothetical protein
MLIFLLITYTVVSKVLISSFNHKAHFNSFIQFASSSIYFIPFRHFLFFHLIWDWWGGGPGWGGEGDVLLLSEGYLVDL